MNGQPKVDATKSDRLSPRHAWRYKLATLLTNGQFDAAKNEAMIAWRKGEIIEDDIRFVEAISNAAQKQSSQRPPA